MWVRYNPNPTAATRVGDCAVRAVAKALGVSWARAYAELCAEGYAQGDLPSSNAVWGEVLRKHGFTRRMVQANCPACYTVADFFAEYPRGLYVVVTTGHVVSGQNGNWYDTWDSGDEHPIYYFVREGE